jgi:hypothetical protein
MMFFQGCDVARVGQNLLQIHKGCKPNKYIATAQYLTINVATLAAKVS